MSKVNVVGISKAKIYPLNNQESYSPYKNNSVLNFEIAPQSDRMVDPRTIRLNFELDVITTAADAYRVAEDVNIDSRIGVESIWDLIRIRQQTTNEVLEESRNYGFQCAASMPAGTSLDNYKKHVSVTYSATAVDERQQDLISAAVPVSMVLKTGLCSAGQLWNLSAMGGVKFELVMNPLSQTLHGNDAGDFYYRIRQCNMTFSYVNLASPISSNQYQVAYPLYTSFSSVLSSSNDQLSLVFAQSQVRAVFSTTVASANLNNLELNAFRTDKIQSITGGVYSDASVQELIVYKDSVKFPFDYIINERDAVSNGVYECLKNKLFLDCFQQFTAISNTLQSTVTQGTKTHRDGKYGYDVPDAREYTGLGVNYDALRNASSVSFTNSLFALRVNSELTNGTPNNIFTFTLSNRMLNTSPMGATQVD